MSRIRIGRRGLAGGVLVGLLVPLLSGCLRYQVDVVAELDDTVSGTIVQAFDAQATAWLTGFDEPGDGGSGPLADMESNFAAARELASSGTFEVEPYDEDGFTGFRARFADLPAEDLGPIFEILSGDDASGAPDATMVLRREADRYVFEAVDRSGGEASEAGSALGRALFRDSDLRISVTFPGPVLDTDGEVAGSTVTWRTDQLLGSPTIRAVGDARAPGLPGGGYPPVLAGVGVVALLVAVLVVAFRLGADRGSEVEGGPPPAVAPDPATIPADFRLPHEDSGTVRAGNVAWDLLPDGCRDGAVAGDGVRVDMRSVRHRGPAAEEHWQLATYPDEQSAAGALAAMRARMGCTGQVGPELTVPLGDDGFARNVFEGGRAVGERGRAAHWVGTRVGSAVLLLVRRVDPAVRADLRVPERRSVDMVGAVVGEMCASGWRCR